MIHATPLWTDSATVVKDSEAVRKALTFLTRYDEQYVMYKEFMLKGKPYLAIPRNCLPIAADDRRCEGSAVNFTSHFVPHPKFPEQARVVAHSVARLKAGESHIVQAPTGFGKTYVGCEIAAQIGRRTMVFTTKEDIIDQWVSAAKAVLGLKDEEIGLIQADTCRSEGYKFVIGLVHSVLKGPKRYSPEAYADFGLVIVDEVHRMGAETFSDAIWHFDAKLRLGLSATPDRKDGRTQIFKAHIGEVKVSATQEVMIPKILVTQSGWKVPKVNWYGKLQKMPHTAGKTMQLAKSMANCVERNQKMVKFVRSAWAKGRNTIFFSETMDHLEIMHKELLGAGIPTKDIGFYVGLQYYEGSKAERKQTREKVKVKPVILATYKMASEATDIPWLDTAVFGMPRSDVVQIAGRIRREFEGKTNTPVIFDLVDSDSSVFDSYFKSRLKWYRSIGAEVKVV